jgi:hypothetical protein
MSDAEQEAHNMREYVNSEFPFFIEEFSTPLLSTFMNYCLTISRLGRHTMVDSNSRNSVEKAFMYITTKDRDCFITSLRQVTISDLQFFEQRYSDDST